MKNEWTAWRQHPVRLMWIAVSVMGLLMVFLFQDFSWLVNGPMSEASASVHFVVKKVLRIVLNDTCMLLLIHAWFYDKKITAIGWRLQLIDTFILLPVYLVLKLSLEGPGELSSPLLSQLHRLIVNPTIMILLIPAVYFQRMTDRRKKKLDIRH